MNSNSLLMLDRVLDHLESMATSDSNENHFLSTALQELRNAVDAVAVFAIVPTLQDEWTIRGGCGSFAESDRSRLLEQFTAQVTKLRQDHLEHTTSDTLAWYAYEVSNQWPMLGYLVLLFEKPLSPSSTAGLREIVQSFSEIFVTRQIHTLEHFFQHEWLLTQRIAADVNSAVTKPVAAAVLVNGLAEIFEGARVSLYQKYTSRTCRLLSVSSVASIDTKSPVVKSLTKIAQQVLEKKQAVIGHATELKQVGNVQTNYAFLPLAARSKKNIQWILGIEFPTAESFSSSVAKLKLLMPTIDLAWNQKAQLLEIPPLVFNFFHRTNTSAPSLFRIAKILAVCVAIAACGWWMLLPQTLVIEAEGALRPSQAKAVFASADGFVTDLLVKENDQVQVDQVLARLKSPALELQTEELLGQFRSLDEQARGIRIAMNQLSTSSADQLSEQSVMASKLTDIEIQQSSLSKQLEIIESQNSALEIKSPIAGIVTGKELRQNLIGRPVTRGDELFGVMNLESVWQIKVQVADRDSHYVASFYGENAKDKNLELRFLLDSSPEVEHHAKVIDMANRASNIHREGCFVEVTADTADINANDVRAGGNVHAYFDCGTKPTWFVWLRPFIESLQRKFWL